MCVLIFYKAIVYLKFHLLQPPKVDPGSPLKQKAKAPKFLGESLSLTIMEAAQTTVVHVRIIPNFLLPLPAAEGSTHPE